MKDLKIKTKLSFNLNGTCLKVTRQTLHPETLIFQLKAIRFVNSVCTIFSLKKQGTPHQTFPRYPELTSAVSLRKQGTCADTVCKTNGLLFLSADMQGKQWSAPVFLNFLDLLDLLDLPNLLNLLNLLYLLNLLDLSDLTDLLNVPKLGSLDQLAFWNCLGPSTPLRHPGPSRPPRASK